MKRLIPFFIIFLVYCGGKKQEKKDPWDEYLPKVQQMFEEVGGDTASLSALSDSLYAFYKNHPDSKGRKDALFYACNWAYASFNYPKTVERCGEFIQQFPSSAKVEDAYRFLGYALLQMKKFDEVIEIMSHFIENYPDAATLGYAYKYRGIAFTYKGKFKEAKKDLNMAKTMLETLGRYEEIQEIDEALKKLK